MIVDILKSERSSFEKAAALIDIQVFFYTNENEERLLKMEVVDDDVSKKLIFNFARMASLQNEIINL